MSTPSLDLTAPVPEEWQTWDSHFDYPTIDDLLTEMNTKVCSETLHAPTEAAILEANNRYLEMPSTETLLAVHAAYQRQSIAFTAQALRMGYAIGMTYAYAPLGPKAWYTAALRFASITIPTHDQQDAANARLNTVTERNGELHGFQKIDPASAGNGGPVKSRRDLARLADYRPRHGDEEASS